ncbi:hypothetical protein VNI00_017777 [Paramarasmius palmivorus]|uniref:CCHC-type domain-containing protein n=1 Tax=Paramarasmius palmivorus TaxID=297713 RepID=A0AAW0B3L8_9AGAR
MTRYIDIITTTSTHSHRTPRPLHSGDESPPPLYYSTGSSRPPRFRLVPATWEDYHRRNEILSRSRSTTPSSDESDFGFLKVNRFVTPETSPFDLPPEDPSSQADNIDTPDPMTSIMTLEPFWGDGRASESPPDFLRSFLRTRNASETDDVRIRSLRNFLKHGSPADEWFKGLDAEVKKDWDRFEEEFEKRWPEIAGVKKEKSEYEDELLALRLKEEELGKKVERHGVDVYTHIDFASRLLELAKGAGVDGTSTFIRQVRNELPDVLKEKVGSEFTDWNAFSKAIRDVDVTYLKDAARRMEKAKKDQQEVLARIRELEALSSPTAPLRRGLAATQISRNTRATSPTRNSQARDRSATPNNTAKPTIRQTTSSASGFSYPPLTDTQIKALEQRLDSIPLQPNTPAGLESYRTQIKTWEEKHGSTARVDHEKPFPLLPGGAKVCTGECFKCGTHGHTSYMCPLPKDQWVDPRERGWRRLCQYYLKSFRAPKDPGAGVYLVEVEDDDEQGKEQGPSV